MMDGFKIGDVVRLKSGGEAMTVAGVREDRDIPGEVRIECEWFESVPTGGRRLERSSFPPAMLRKVEETEWD